MNAHSDPCHCGGVHWSYQVHRWSVDEGSAKVLAGLLYPISLEAIMCLDEKISFCFSFYRGWESATGLICWTPLTTTYPSVWWPSGLVNVLVEQVDSSLVLETTGNHIRWVVVLPLPPKIIFFCLLIYLGQYVRKNGVTCSVFFLLVFPSAV